MNGGRLMIKKVFLVLFLFLSGCTTNDTVTLEEEVTLSYFYITTCGDCSAFKEDAIPYLEDKFGESITINQYDLDDASIVDKYDSIIDSLDDFDEEFYGNGPFIVVEGYFALLGYSSGDEEYLAEDIISATQGGELSEELSYLRFMYK